MNNNHNCDTSYAGPIGAAGKEPTEAESQAALTELHGYGYKRYVEYYYSILSYQQSTMTFNGLDKVRTKDITALITEMQYVSNPNVMNLHIPGDEKLSRWHLAIYTAFEIMKIYRDDGCSVTVLNRIKKLHQDMDEIFPNAEAKLRQTQKAVTEFVNQFPPEEHKRIREEIVNQLAEYKPLSF